MFFNSILIANNDNARTAFQLAQLQSGSLALNARINSVTKFNETVIKDNNSSAKILGLPSDCPPPTIKDNSSGGHRHHIPTCSDCCSSSDDDYDSANSSTDGREIIQRERSKEKDLKDFAYSRTLAHFQVDATQKKLFLLIITVLRY